MEEAARSQTARRQTIAGGCFDSGEELRVSWVSIKGVTALNNTSEFVFLHSWNPDPFFRAPHPPECFMIVSHMPTYFPPLGFTPCSSPCMCRPATSSLSSPVFDGFAQKSTKLPALSTGRRITSSVISPCCRGTQTPPGVR